ncbi:hypothetical protein Patl1_30994 [Pistacia atlantica]|uniref:Uncharacterized protein n=1 Tax=Pistacia atlantica TaxID=434234 RepID=A0ACC1AD18_9ROSI|nr:hypothetical protein Patl1_30994 [Pistacia atlantica]
MIYPQGGASSTLGEYQDFLQTVFQIYVREEVYNLGCQPEDRCWSSPNRIGDPYLNVCMEKFNHLLRNTCPFPDFSTKILSLYFGIASIHVKQSTRELRNTWKARLFRSYPNDHSI